MSVVLEEGRGQRKDKLKTPLTTSKRGRFPPPLVAPVVLERQSSHVWGEMSYSRHSIRQWRISNEKVFLLSIVT